MINQGNYIRSSELQLENNSPTVPKVLKGPTREIYNEDRRIILRTVQLILIDWRTKLDN